MACNRGFASGSDGVLVALPQASRALARQSGIERFRVLFTAEGIEITFGFWAADLLSFWTNPKPQTENTKAKAPLSNTSRPSS